MVRLKILSAGESHGRGLTGILEGMPAGLSLSPDDIDRDLSRRQQGYGRGGRMKIERDRAELLAGVRWGATIGAPIAIFIENRDWKNWQTGMSHDRIHEGSVAPVTRPRPGHADLAGALKYGHSDIRNILERSSARETAMRVALGAVAKKFLRELGISVGSYVSQIGAARMTTAPSVFDASLCEKAEASVVRCPDEGASAAMVSLIDQAREQGDTLGGIFTVVATGVPVGLGSHTQWDRRLDGRLAQAFMGIQAIKGVEIGSGFAMAGQHGSEVMDEIFFGILPGDLQGAGAYYRVTNHAGGIEGGMTNGMPVVVSAAMKPIPTQRRPLRSVDMVTKTPVEAAYERSDICAVPAAAVIGEAMAALVLADAAIEKFGGDSMTETMRNVRAYRDHVASF